MSSEVALPPDFRQRVTDHVKSTMFQLLPDEQFAQLVEKEMTEFFSGEGVEFVTSELKRGSHWSYDEWCKKCAKVTPFRKLIWDTMQPLIQRKFEDMLQADAFAKIVQYTEKTDQWAARKLVLAKETDELIERVAIAAAVEQQRATMLQAVKVAVSHVEQDMARQLGRISVIANLDQNACGGVDAHVMVAPDATPFYRNPNGSGFVDQHGNTVYA